MSDPAALLLRLGLATVIFPHGAQHALGAFGGPGFTATMQAFREQWSVPGALTVLVIAAELLGPIALLFGFFTRFAALAIAAVMVGAIWLQHWDQGFFMDWYGQKQGEGFEYHLLAISIALALALAGAGRWSLDSRLWRKRV